ncbi:MAG: 50S ribosomal protein L4 [Candidatus Omnitrophica bacterium]|nr:50S ribosomal protein L4 [Candidatus Omnitrophota bacterium]
MREVSVFNIGGSEVERLNLNEKIFSGKVNKILLSEVILMYQANKRMGLASTKTRAKVRGGGRKPWRQKGTGRARVGSIRSPLWRGGGIVFGPHPRDYSYYLPKKARRQALLSALNLKFNEKHFLVIDKISLSRIKTKDFMKILKNISNIVKNFDEIANKSKEILKPKKIIRFLFIVENRDKNLMLSSRNLGSVNIVLENNLNALDVLLHDYLIFSKQALENFVKNFNLG